jgi:hypothetical protein
LMPLINERRGYEPIEWPVYKFEISLTPRAGLRQVFQLRGGWPKDGVFVPKGWPKRRGRDDHPKPTRDYSPLPAADQILQEISRLSPDDSNALLQFVNQGGLMDQGYVASVADTRAWVAWVKRMTERLFALQRGLVRGDSWADFAFNLNGVIHNIGSAVRPGNGGLERYFRTPRLLDVLALRVLECATGTTGLRQCRWCKAFFTPDRKDQQYCKTGGKQRCARRAAVEAHRKRSKRLKGRKQ